jgi:integrase
VSTLQAWIADHLADLEARGYRARSVATYRKALARLVPELRQAGDAAALLRALGELAPATRAVYLAAARGFDAWCVEVGLTDRAAFAGRVRLRRDEPEPRPFEAGELRALDAAAGARRLAGDARARRLRLLYWILRDTGVRIDEALSLRWSDVALAPGREGLRLGETKNRRARVLPLLQGQALALLKVAARRRGDRGDDAADGWVLAVDEAGARPWSYRAALVAFHQLAERAGVREAVPHRLRHSRATALVEDGASPFVLRQAMGWEKLETAARYVRAPELRRELGRLERARGCVGSCSAERLPRARNAR